MAYDIIPMVIPALAGVRSFRPTSGLPKGMGMDAEVNWQAIVAAQLTSALLTHPQYKMSGLYSADAEVAVDLLTTVLAEMRGRGVAA
jgi:hypothetical protein